MVPFLSAFQIPSNGDVFGGMLARVKEANGTSTRHASFVGGFHTNLVSKTLILAAEVAGAAEVVNVPIGATQAPTRSLTLYVVRGRSVF